MKHLILGLFLIYSTTSLDFPTNLCPIIAEKPDPLNPKIKLPSSYKLEGTVTDWINGRLSYFTETSFNGALSVSVSFGENNIKLVQLEDHFYSVNATDCVQNNDLRPYNIPQSIVDLLNATTYNSISSLIEKILVHPAVKQGRYNDSEVVAGVGGVSWISCYNNTNNNTKNGLQIEVVYADKGSFKPASSSFKNPQVLFIRLSEYSLEKNGSNLTNSISFSVDKKIAVTDDEDFRVPSGVLCNGRKTVSLNLQYSDPVSVIVTDSTNTTFEVYYSTKENVVIISGGAVKKGNVIPLFNITAQEDAFIFVHDYSTGYEYGLDLTNCKSIRAIDKTSKEVKDDGNKISMKTLDDVLINQTIQWQDYGKNENIESHRVYRAALPDRKVLELVKGDRQITINTYLEGKLLTTYTVLKLSYTLPPPISSLVRDCYAKQPGDSFTFLVKDKAVEHVSTVGEEIVTQSLAKKLSELGAINPNRVKASYNNGANGNLQVFLRVAKKNNNVPQNTTTSFNYQTEVDTDRFFITLNQTMKKQDWTFNVAEQTWSATRGSLAHYPPPPPPTPYQGYTGGSMFVLGLFSLVFGAGLGAGALFFITRRQRISTLAYQVFE